MIFRITKCLYNPSSFFCLIKVNFQPTKDRDVLVPFLLSFSFLFFQFGHKQTGIMNKTVQRTDQTVRDNEL